MKQSILSQKQSTLLENLIAKYGNVVTSRQIFEISNNTWDYKQTKNIITKLTKDGWLIRVKRGTYAISELSSRGFLTLSTYYIANLLAGDSYVSFASALQYHNMFDQLTNKTISVGLKAHKTKRLDNTEYHFIKTKAALFFGYEEVNIENKTVHIATAEKALVDMVNFHKNKKSIDLCVEILTNYKHNLNFNRLNEHLSKFSITTIKIFGLIFDLLRINSDYLYTLIKKKHGTHRMLADSKKFNAKWRLYYDEFFDQYKSFK